MGAPAHANRNGGGKAVAIHRCGPAKIARVRALLEEYWSSFGFAGDFQGFRDELASLPGRYSPPGGLLLLATVGGGDAGCIALRRLSPAEAEVKRLYVRPLYRGYGIGVALLEHVMAHARSRDYRRLLADTMPPMVTALGLYERHGFVRRGPYGASPTPGAIYLELGLPGPGGR